MKHLEQEKGFNISMLKPGTILILETLYSYYNIKIIEGKNVMVTGGMTKSGEDRFPNPTKAIICGSAWDETSIIKIDWIGHQMRLEIIWDNNKLLTSRIIEATIESPNKSWSYSMEWSK